MSKQKSKNYPGRGDAYRERCGHTTFYPGTVLIRGGHGCPECGHMNRTGAPCQHCGHKTVALGYTYRAPREGSSKYRKHIAYVRLVADCKFREAWALLTGQ